MTLQAVAQVLGGIGVIASLIYVAIQIRNNVRATRAATYQQLSASFATSWDSMARDGAAVALVLKGGDDFAALNRVEQTQMYFHTMSSMRRFENAWFQHEIGTLKEDDWQAIAYDLNSIFAYPGSRHAWHGVKNRSNAKFRAYVDGVVAKQEQAAKP